jgi:hypothetical protein
MQTQFNPLKHLAALATFLLVAAAPLQKAHALGEGNLRTEAPSNGGSLRDTPDEEKQPAESAPPTKDDAGDEQAAEEPAEAEAN